MTFEASMTIGTGCGVTARLHPSQNRIEIEIHGYPEPGAVAMVVPRCLELVATKAGLPIRHDGKVYRPRRIPVPATDDEWGDAS